MLWTYVQAGSCIVPETDEGSPAMLPALVSMYRTSSSRAWSLCTQLTELTAGPHAPGVSSVLSGTGYIKLVSILRSTSCHSSRVPSLCCPRTGDVLVNPCIFPARPRGCERRPFYFVLLFQNPQGQIKSKCVDSKATFEVQYSLRQDTRMPNICCSLAGTMLERFVRVLSTT